MIDAFEPIAEAALAGLREPAPPGLAHATLVAVGLADDYAVMDSPVGPLRVAWNGRGVSTVEEAPSDEAFEARFLARMARAARRLHGDADSRAGLTSVFSVRRQHTRADSWRDDDGVLRHGRLGNGTRLHG